MKKTFFILILSIAAIMHGFSQTAYLTVGNVTGTSGNPANVPVTISGVDGNSGGTPIIGLNIYVTYTTSVVTYLGVINTNATLNAAGTWYTSTINSGTMNANWLEGGSSGTSLPDGSTIFEIQFIANNGGTSALNLINIEVLDVNGNPLTTVLTNGSITYPAPPSVTTWNGTGIWYTPANWSAGVPGAATQAFIASGVVTIDAAPAYSGNLSINPGAGITLNASKSLNVNGNLVLESNASATATGSFLNNGSLSVTGTTTVKRYVSGGIQHFISIPVTAATIGNLYNASNPGYFFNFTEATSTWSNPWNLNFALLLANGYSVNYNAAQTISLSGTLNNDSQYQPIITRNGGGWNLVGNAYPCPLDWDNASGWTKTNLDNAIYIWKDNVYASYVGGVGTNGGSKYIPQFQGFFIHANAAAPAITMKKAARTHSGNATNFMKEMIPNVFRLSISDGTLTEETAIRLAEGASTEFDPEFDAYKLFGFNEMAPHIYTLENNIEYAINSLPLAESTSLPIVFKTSQAGTYTIEATGFETFDGYYFFVLQDEETGISYDLKQTSQITLNLNEGFSGSRFTLRIFKSSLGIGDSEFSSTRIYAEHKNVIVENCPSAEITIYTSLGAAVTTLSCPESSFVRIPVEVPAGIYIVRLMTPNGSTSTKVFIK